MIRLAIIGALSTMLAAAPAFAQTASQPNKQAQPSQSQQVPVQREDAEAEDNELHIPDVPQPGFVLAKDLDSLFAQLKRAASQKRAERISTAIWEHWHRSDSRSVDLLTTWARAAAERKSFGKALDLLDQVVVLRPNYAEGFNQRATLHFMMKNFSKSVADIERTLALEPRHFGALAGLANILEQQGYKKRALATWYRALEVYPAMRPAQTAVLRLEEELAGSGI
ncbi:MAG: hypothetical protein OXR62_11750 [Ahrensia sp.]|nr:hypothetical protein [Ahrensia sp.]